MMSQELAIKFANALIKGTLSNVFIWTPLTDGTMIDGECVRVLLRQWEFHEIYYFESYFLQLPQGTVFLVSEYNISGRDARESTEGFHLYVKSKESNEVSSVMFDTDELYRLKNAIQSKMDLSPDAINFITDFLNSEN